MALQLHYLKKQKIHEKQMQNNKKEIDNSQMAKKASLMNMIIDGHFCFTSFPNHIQVIDICTVLLNGLFN